MLDPIKLFLASGLLGLEALLLVAAGGLPIPQIPPHGITDVYLEDPLFDVCTRKGANSTTQGPPFNAPSSMNSLTRAQDHYQRIMHYLYNPELSKTAQESVVRTSLPDDERLAFRTAVDGSFCYSYPYDSRHVGAFAFNWPLSAMMALVLDLCDASSSFACENEAAKIDKTLEKYGQPCVDPDTLVDLGCFTSDAFPPLNREKEFQERYRSIHFFDDAVFIARQLMRAHFIFTNRGDGDRARTYLDHATRAHQFAMLGEARSSDVAPGGIRWMYQDWHPHWADRGTNTNAGAAQLAIMLYIATGQTAYFDDGMRLYRWTNATLKDSATGLFNDRIIGTSRPGSVKTDPTYWSYNQGLMIGLNVLIHHASGNVEFLREAESIARASVEHFTPAHLDAQSPAYNRIYAENLFLLSLKTQDRELKGAIRESMNGYIERFARAESNFDPLTGLVRLEGSPEQVLEASSWAGINAINWLYEVEGKSFVATTR